MGDNLSPKFFKQGSDQQLKRLPMEVLTPITDVLLPDVSNLELNVSCVKILTHD
jgi:hypothetical protein